MQIKFLHKDFNDKTGQFFNRCIYSTDWGIQPIPAIGVGMTFDSLLEENAGNWKVVNVIWEMNFLGEEDHVVSVFVERANR